MCAIICGKLKEIRKYPSTINSITLVVKVVLKQIFLTLLHHNLSCFVPKKNSGTEKDLRWQDTQALAQHPLKVTFLSPQILLITGNFT